MRLSKRLGAISDFIPDNSFILDIGCDHALLDIYCVLNKKNVKAIASDINEGPLEKAKENIEKYNVKNVSIFLGDGLSAYKEGVDTVVMSGLGSTTIVNILKEGSNVLNKIDRLIISSNNDYYFLRKSICSLGFYISDEIIICDRNKFYPIMVFEKGNFKYSKKDFLYGPVLLKNKSKEFVDYLVCEKDKLFEIVESLNGKHFVKKYYLKKNIKAIDKILGNTKFDA